MKRPERFNDKEQRVLRALSHPRYKWRSILGIERATGLSSSDIQDILAALLGLGVIQPSLSRDKKPIFVLSERVNEPVR